MATKVVDLGNVRGPQGPKGDSWNSGIPITIPGAWVRGDINHDGVVDMSDYSMVNAIANGSITLEGTALEAADADNNGVVDNQDKIAINAMAFGTRRGEDLLGNWAAGTGCYTVEIPVTGMASGDSVVVYIPDAAAVQHCEFSGECLAGKLKITCKWAPAVDVTAYVQSGVADGVRFVTDRIAGVKEKDTRACAVVVGTTGSGHTLNDCDFLCDGTNDTATINAAIRASLGGTVHLLRGNYYINGQLEVFTKNTILEGDGCGTVLNCTMNESAYESIFVNAQYSVIRDLALVQKENTSGYTSTGIYVDTETVEIQNVLVDGFDTAINLYSTWRGKVSKCMLYRNLESIVVDASSRQITIDGNIFWLRRTTDKTDEHKSVYIAGTTNQDVLIVNNQFVGLPLVNEGGTNIVIANNIE